MNVYHPIQWDNSIREKHYESMIEYVLKQFDKETDPEVVITEDAEFEIIQPKQLTWAKAK